MIDLQDISRRWQKRWEDAKLFETEPDERPKFFCNFPYPYINAYQHIGHFFTLMRVEAMARFKRLQGYNVLFPQGWHATGSPIVNAAKRVKAREEKQIKIMHDMGFSDKEIEKFEDPAHWVEHFAPEFESDYRRMGMSVDFRRSFVTTSLSPHYDAFIQWQFRKLKEKGYAIKGKFPVVWDPVENNAVGDHARVEGEGETPQELCLFKFQLGDGRFIITATLRPDTLLGITNVYVHPEETYAVVSCMGEEWIIGKPMIAKLGFQEYEVKEVGEVSGRDLVGQKVATIVGTEIPVLPATFLDSSFGTGMVHSVPSESADDFIALKNLQEDDKRIAEFGLDSEMVKSISVIPIFDTPEIGENAAEYFITKYKVKNQNDRGKLETIRKELYTLSFNKAVFGEKYKDVFGLDVSGKLVKDGQELIKQKLLETGKVHLYYELTGKVVSRTLTECVVKIVDDQWFLNYNDPAWKKLAHACLDRMKLFPEKSRDQFNYVIDWLHEWACTREEGLGTKLPWDEKWLIESLSDSTIYMAYYTVAHLVTQIDVGLLTDEVFDYIFLDGSREAVSGISGVAVELLDEMKKQFNYYYPVDFRNSGKDLIQNHLTFYIFNHVALFGEDKWPTGIGANGWVTVDGQKMSKSLGNMIPTRDMEKEYSADASRITILNGGEDMDDPNWDSSFAQAMMAKLNALHDFCVEHYKKHDREQMRQIDQWFESELNRIIRDTTAACEETQFRSAIQLAYFEMQRVVKHYMKRTSGDVHGDLMNRFIDAQLIMLVPFAPHVCEEIWEKIGNNASGTDFISTVDWPGFDEHKIDARLVMQEAFVDTLFSDIRSVKELAKLESISEITLFTADVWKYSFLAVVGSEISDGNRDFKSILSKIMADASLKVHGKQITKLLPTLIKKGVSEVLSQEDERTILEETKGLIEKEFGCKVSIVSESDSSEKKAKQAMPGKVALVVK